MGQRFKAMGPGFSLSCFMQLKESVAVACHCLDQTLHVTQGGPKKNCSAYLLSEATGRHVEIRCFSWLYHHLALHFLSESYFDNSVLKFSIFATCAAVKYKGLK